MITEKQITDLINSGQLVDIKDGLLKIFDMIMNEGVITSEEDLGKIAKLRSRTEIHLSS